MWFTPDTMLNTVSHFPIYVCHPVLLRSVQTNCAIGISSSNDYSGISALHNFIYLIIPMWIYCSKYQTCYLPTISMERFLRYRESYLQRSENHEWKFRILRVLYLNVLLDSTSGPTAMSYCILWIDILLKLFHLQCAIMAITILEV